MKNKNKAVWGTRFNNATSKIFEQIGASVEVDKRLFNNCGKGHFIKALFHSHYNSLHFYDSIKNWKELTYPTKLDNWVICTLYKRKFFLDTIPIKGIFLFL